MVDHSSAFRSLSATLLLAAASLLAACGPTVRYCGLCATNACISPAAPSNPRRMTFESPIEVEPQRTAQVFESTCLECPPESIELDPGRVCGPLRHPDRQDALRSCYCRLGASGPVRALVQFQLDERKGPQSLSVALEPEPHDPRLASCVEEAVQATSFCPSTSGPVQVTLNLAFAEELESHCPAASRAR